MAAAANGPSKSPAKKRPTSEYASASSDKEPRSKNDTTFFNTIRSPRKQYFTIHPEWVSENLSVRRVNIAEGTRSEKMVKKRQTYTVHPEWSSENPNVKKVPPKAKPRPTLENRYHTFPPRRCRSAPPPQRERNPITWENYNVSGR